MSRRTRWVIVVLTLVVGTACSGSAGHPASAVRGPVFYAAIAAHHGAVEAVSATTGGVLHQVAPARRDGMSVAGVSRVGPDALLITYARGPQCSSGVAGCGPRPHTCGAEVLRVSTATGKSTVIWRVGRDDLLHGAELSPDGKMLAALVSPCVRSYFNDHIVVRRLSDGKSWVIGRKLPQCHRFSDPQWESDSRHLVVTYGLPSSSAPYTGPPGTCWETADSSLVRVDAGRPQPPLSGETLRPRRSCRWQSPAIADRAVYAIEACGQDVNRLDGAVTLVQLTSILRPQHRWSVGACTDGNSVAADNAQGVILSAYLFCNPPPPGQQSRDPVTVLDRLQSGHLRRVASAPGGYTAWDALAW